MCIRDRDSTGVYFAPVANSPYGLGGELVKAQPRWRAFGSNTLPAAPIGVAFASPVLRMLEGTRKVSLDLTLGGLNGSVHSASGFAAAFQAYVCLLYTSGLPVQCGLVVDQRRVGRLQAEACA